MRFILTIGIFTALALAGQSLSAHENFRVIGTVVALTASSVEIKSRDGRTVSIELSESTEVSRDEKAIKVDELQAGHSVVIDAYGDDLTDLLALKIRVVPSIVAPAN